MSNICFYSIAGLNYKHQYSSCCPIQSDRLSKFTDTIIPSEIFNSKESYSLDLIKEIIAKRTEKIRTKVIRNACFIDCN